MMRRLWKVKGEFQGEKVEMAIIVSADVERKTIRKFCILSELENFDTDPIVDAELIKIEDFDTILFEEDVFYLKDWEEMEKTFKTPTFFQ